MLCTISWNALKSSPEYAILENLSKKFLNSRQLLKIVKNCQFLADRETLLEAGNVIFMKLATDIGMDSSIEHFVELLLMGMKRLQEKGENNLVYKFCACVGKELSLMPLERMPFGHRVLYWVPHFYKHSLGDYFSLIVCLH